MSNVGNTEDTEYLEETNKDYLVKLLLEDNIEEVAAMLIHTIIESYDGCYTVSYITSDNEVYDNEELAILHEIDWLEYDRF